MIEYRVVRTEHPDGVFVYTIKSVTTDTKTGKLVYISVDDEYPRGETLSELEADCKKMGKALEKPVLDDPLPEDRKWDIDVEYLDDLEEKLE